MGLEGMESLLSVAELVQLYTPKKFLARFVTINQERSCRDSHRATSHSSNA